MTNLRKLNDAGERLYREWLRDVKGGAKLLPPVALLDGPETSTPMGEFQEISQEPLGRRFASRYELGVYLRDVLAIFEKTEISRMTGLWNWLSLFLVDQLAPAQSDGTRKILDPEVYILDPTFRYNSYYRHAIRSAWYAVQEHEENSRVLLVPAGKTPNGIGVLAHRGELIEQLASRQQMIGSKSLIAAANTLYMNVASGTPKRGAGGSSGGSPRRLANLVQQLDLTYDLNACSSEAFLKLLPSEYDRWKEQSPTIPAAASKARKMLQRLGLPRAPQTT